MLLSIIISTYKRPQLLRHMLVSLERQLVNIADDTLEIIVVDNDELASARDMLIPFQSTSPIFRYVHEPQTGLSFARNSGAKNATGAYLLFLDDDAEAAPDFITTLISVLPQHQPDFFGGPVLPLYTEGKPDWFPEKYETRRHATASGFTHSASFSGAQFGVKAETFMRLGGFDTTKGMVGSKLRFLEERALLDVYRRTTAPELQKIYDIQECIIQHMTPRARMSLRYQMKRLYLSHADRGRYIISKSTSPRWRIRLILIAYAIIGFGAHISLLAFRWKQSNVAEKLVDALFSLSGRLGLIFGLLSHAPQASPAMVQTLHISDSILNHAEFLQKQCLGPYGHVKFSKWPGLWLIAKIRYQYPWLGISCSDNKTWFSHAYPLIFDALEPQP